LTKNGKIAGFNGRNMKKNWGIVGFDEKNMRKIGF
jgi:hypothetical protein